MGAWGMQAFENDAALDFTAQLFHESQAGDLGFLREAIQDVFQAQQESYIDSDIGSPAVAAAAILSYLKQGSDAQEILKIQPFGQAWLDAARQADYQTLIPDALKALELVLADNSELYELWEETGYFAEWLDSVKQIKTVLNS